MLKQLWKKYKNSQDEKLLAQYKARDAEFGTPTKETLNERAAKAAEKGLWKTAIAALDQGADVNQKLKWKQFYSGTQLGGLDFEENYSLSFLAIKQNNAAALDALLGKGADPAFTGTSRVNERTHSYSLPEYAALNGAAESLDLLLSKAKFSQEALSGALKITASEKSYNPMTVALLAAGAQDYEPALRSAEGMKNNKAVLLINAAKAKKPEASALANDAKADVIAAILENSSAEERRKVIAGLQLKFTDDFAAVAPKPAAPEAPAPVRTYYPSIH